MTQPNLSARAFSSILKFAHTIADLAGIEEITKCMPITFQVTWQYNYHVKRS